MGDVVHLHHRGVFGRRWPAEAPADPNASLVFNLEGFLGTPPSFLRQEVITTPTAQPPVETPQAGGDYLRSLPPESLSARQARELALQTAAGLAKDPHAAEMLRRKADMVAQSLPEPTFQAPRRHAGNSMDGYFEPRHKPVTLWPWILVMIATALALAVTPAEWWA